MTTRELAETVHVVVGFEGGGVFDVRKPDGAPRKLMDVPRLKQAGLKAKIELRRGLDWAYAHIRRHVSA